MYVTYQKFKKLFEIFIYFEPSFRLPKTFNFKISSYFRGYIMVVPCYSRAHNLPFERHGHTKSSAAGFSEVLELYSLLLV
jgi:hypothetical protein